MYRPDSKNRPKFQMPEQSTRLIRRTYQGKYNGTVVLTYEQRTKQF